MAISREKMAELDKRAIEDFGISGLVLMEVAAVKIFEKVKDYSSFFDFSRPWQQRRRWPGLG